MSTPHTLLMSIALLFHLYIIRNGNWHQTASVKGVIYISEEVSWWIIMDVHLRIFSHWSLCLILHFDTTGWVACKTAPVILGGFYLRDSVRMIAEKYQF